MKILFDRYGIQVESPCPDRLTPLYDAINAVDGWSHDIAPGPLSPEALQGSKVLVLTTRNMQPFAAEELSAIISFVQAGGGLWCMANHAAFNVRRMDDNLMRYTSAVASTFFTSYEAAAYQRPDHNEVDLTGSNLSSQEIITGKSNWPLYGSNLSPAIKVVVTRSFCGIYPNNFGDTVAALAGLDNVVNMQERPANVPITPDVLWAIALDGDVTGQGRVVICADSGWIGSVDTDSPGKGEFQNGDNPQFALNTLSWLAQL